VSLLERTEKPINNNLKTYEDMVSDLEQNQIVFSFVNRINDLKKSGKKSFGIMSIGYPELQHRVILAASGLLQRYNMNEKLGIVINSKSLVLQKFIKKSEKYERKFNSSSILNYNFHKKFDFTVMEEFVKYYDQHTELEYYNLINDYNEDNDIILWDLPLISEIKGNHGLYMPLLQEMNDIFLVLPATGTTKDELTLIKEYFTNFNIEIRGVMLETDKSKTKKWWEFWK
jgi:hypothetical protein